MLKRITLAALAAAALSIGTARAEGDLFLYNWTDYTPPELIAKFEKETGIKVTLDTYDSNETLLAKLQAGGTGYDLVVVTSSWVKVFENEGLIQKVDAREMPNFKNLDARWQSPDYDPERAYTVPYQWGFTSFAVNSKAYLGNTNTLKVLFEPPPELQGKIGMLNSPSEVVTLAQTYLDLPFCDTNTENLKRVQGLLLAQAPHVKVYNSDGMIERLSSNEVAMHMGWNGNFIRAREANPDIKISIPKEGVVAWMDNMAVPAGAKNVENAKKFMNFMMEPENIAMVSNFASYASAVPAADEFLTPALREAPELKLPADVKVRFLETCSEQATKLVDRVWTNVKK